jgi:catechol 2,3-dioxygenase-like lactoylglutathione lyase family enzyme
MQLIAVFPISDENVDALPVRQIDAALAFYEGVMGFTAVRRDERSADVQRDKVRLGLVKSDEHEPGKAGSLAFEVEDLEMMHRELELSGAKPGVFGMDEWGGKRYRTFFVREETNGYCYCFFSLAEANVE